MRRRTRFTPQTSRLEPRRLLSLTDNVSTALDISIGLTPAAPVYAGALYGQSLAEYLLGSVPTVAPPPPGAGTIPPFSTPNAPPPVIVIPTP